MTREEFMKLCEEVYDEEIEAASASIAFSLLFLNGNEIQPKIRRLKGQHRRISESILVSDGGKVEIQEYADFRTTKDKGRVYGWCKDVEEKWITERHPNETERESYLRRHRSKFLVQQVKYWGYLSVSKIKSLSTINSHD